MRRKLTEYLMWWKELGGERMPLLLYGARQTGKTYLLREFGAEYFKNTVYLNFEAEPALRSLFEDSLYPAKLLPKLEKYFETRITPSDTLVVFDEIQSCNRALTSLKYFCEDAPEYHVVGAGSLLGVHTSSKDFSFPVGKVISKMMYPMSFEEFLWASDLAVFADRIEACFHSDTPLEKPLHESLLQLYREYLLVGGMPLAVYSYFHQNRILKFTDVQRILVDTYISDMTKYTDRAQSIKTINAYEAIVPQLAKDNKKFQYKLIAKGARASLFGEAIDWLIRAGVVLKSVKTSSGNAPPDVAKDVSAFKLYLNDIGLVSYKAGLNGNNWRIFDQTYLGGIIENYVACTLAGNDYELFYWEAAAQAEVDFVLMRGGEVIPVEVKAGERSRSQSLKSYMKNYNPKYAIRISGKNFGLENGIKAVPHYAVYLI